MKTSTNFVALNLYLLIFILVPSLCFADISFNNGFWSSTFDCNEMTITSTGTNICDGLDVVDRYTADGTHDTQITSSANSPSGSGGRGYRHWIGTSRNNHSSAFRANFPSRQNEVWVRWHQRWQPGFSWAGIYHHKILYFWSTSQWFYLNIPQWADNNISTLGVNVNGGNSYRSTTQGWYTAQGNSTVADGNWDSYEIYVKINSTPGTPDGIIRIWINGELSYENISVELLDSSASGDGFIHNIDIGQNHDTANNPAPYYEDYDDIVIALPTYTGFVNDAHGNKMIGTQNPIGTTNPTPPQNFRIVASSQ